MAALEPRNFLQPCLLLLLREQSDHGYDLAVRLRPLHDGEGDAGGVYRALRALEGRDYVNLSFCRPSPTEYVRVELSRAPSEAWLRWGLDLNYDATVSGRMLLRACAGTCTRAASNLYEPHELAQLPHSVQPA